MKTYLAVKTENRAKEILLNFAEKNNFKDLRIISGEDRCECGLTTSMGLIHDKTNRFKAFVIVCDACGDNDNFTDDVLKL